VIVARRNGTYVAREDIFLGSGAPRAMEVALDASPPPPEFEPAPILPASPSSGADATPHAPSAALTATPATGTRRDDAVADGGDDLWWLWVGGGIAVTGLVAVALALGLEGSADSPAPIPGDLAPRVLHGRVVAP
jgi:hypothetical protein